MEDNHIVRCWMYNKDRAKDFKIGQEAAGITQE
jgi:peptide/nickel transport system ATP-binding protein/oligopeptide transport system ATP-binding protein